MRQVELKEINNAILYLMNNKSVTGEILTIDSGQSLGWANTKSKVFTRLVLFRVVNIKKKKKNLNCFHQQNHYY